MKKIGQISESRMKKIKDPKFYPLVSDDLFENVVKGRRKNVKKEDAGIGVLNSPGDPLKREDADWKKKLGQHQPGDETPVEKDARLRKQAEKEGKKADTQGPQGNARTRKRAGIEDPTTRNLKEPSAKDKFTNPFVNDSKKVGKARLRKEAESGEFQGQMDPSRRTPRGGTEEERKERAGSGYRGQAPKTQPRSKEEIAKLNKPKEGQMSDLDIKAQEGDPKAKARLKKIEKVKTENDKERKPKRAMFKANDYTTKIKSQSGQVTTEDGGKDDKWIQGANADIKRRGTKGKCTPITKPGCTGKAKALAKTFKKMGRKRDAEIQAKDEK